MSTTGEHIKNTVCTYKQMPIDRVGKNCQDEYIEAVTNKWMVIAYNLKV